MKTAYLALGSNLGNRRQNVLGAIAIMHKTKGIRVRRISRFYETEPWGYKNQPKFINAAVKIQTSLLPVRLLIIIKGIEKKMGRMPLNIKWGPRIIDIDILLYGDRKMKSGRLQIPHPEMHRRVFVLKPLAEIALRVVHPKLRKTIGKLLEELTQEIK
jgi:2-amino-4-hydroxy-6-hydroxymethyldihydropteridine diphosphokinase